ncbi:MAG: MurR/RpiR family transcriptional regulator [Lachnospiraceae bacterium]
MDSIDILDKIKEMTPNFTEKELAVAQYVLANPEKVIYTSINILAEDCGVGDSTVFRFCRTLGSNGYQEFKLLLAQSIQLRNLTLNEVAKAIDGDDDLEAVIEKTYESNRLALKETRERINLEHFSRVVDLLIGANRVLISGVGASLIAGLEFANRFLRITGKFICHLDAHQQSMAASLLYPDDILLAISFSGATKDVVEIAKIAKEQQASVFSITRFEKSPLAQLSDITLLCGANENPYQGGSVSGKIAQLLLLDTLYNEYYRRTYNLSEQNRTQTVKSVLTKLY